MTTTTPPTLRLTARQHQVLDYCKAFLVTNHQPPPMPSIAEVFGWRSNNAAHGHITYLVKKGALEHNEVGNYRITAAGAALQAYSSNATAQPLSPTTPKQGFSNPTRAHHDHCNA